MYSQLISTKYFQNRNYSSTRSQHSKGTNVPQTFHKRSTNVLTSHRNETKTFEFVHISAPSKKIIYRWSMRADSGPNRNNLFSTRQIREQNQNDWVSFKKGYRKAYPFVFDRRFIFPGKNYKDDPLNLLFPFLKYIFGICN